MNARTVVTMATMSSAGKSSAPFPPQGAAKTQIDESEKTLERAFEDLPLVIAVGQWMPICSEAIAYRQRV